MINIYNATASDDLSSIELELYHAIMDYRALNGLPVIPLSKALTTTAGRHAIDTFENIWVGNLTLPAGTNLHSWSDAPYFADHSQPEVMWYAPERLGTGYLSEGFEISAAGFADIDAALVGWMSSAGHNSVILNQDVWAPFTWTAIGIGIERPAVSNSALPFGGLIYHVWFGSAQDATGVPRILGGTGSDHLTGTAFDDLLFGMDGNDILIGGMANPGAEGDDMLDGGPGYDSVVFNGPRSDYTITVEPDGVLTVEDQTLGRDGTDTVIDVEYLDFIDKTITIVHEDGANIARLYSAAFDRSPDKGGLNGWTDFYVTGISADAKAQGVYVALAQTPLAINGLSIAAGFTNSLEFQNTYGALNDNQYVTLLYNNVLGRDPEPAGLNGWLDLMHNSGFSREMVLVGFAQSNENIAKTAADWLIQI